MWEVGFCVQEDGETNPFKPTLIELEPTMRREAEEVWEKMVGAANRVTHI